MIQQLAGTKNIFTGGDTPEKPIGNHRLHHEKLKSSIFTPQHYEPAPQIKPTEEYIPTNRDINADNRNPEIVMEQDSYDFSGRVKKQTDESVDSMFNHCRLRVSPRTSPLGRDRDTKATPDSDTARGAAAANKFSQNNRGYNVLTGQSDVEEAASRDSESVKTSGTAIRKGMMSGAPQSFRPAAGLPPAGGSLSGRPRIRGRVYDSGPLW